MNSVAEIIKDCAGENNSVNIQKILSSPVYRTGGVVHDKRPYEVVNYSEIPEPIKLLFATWYDRDVPLLAMLKHTGPKMAELGLPQLTLPDLYLLLATLETKNKTRRATSYEFTKEQFVAFFKSYLNGMTCEECGLVAKLVNDSGIEHGSRVHAKRLFTALQARSRIFRDKHGRRPVRKVDVILTLLIDKMRFSSGIYEIKLRDFPVSVRVDLARMFPQFEDKLLAYEKERFSRGEITSEQYEAIISDVKLVDVSENIYGEYTSSYFSNVMNRSQDTEDPEERRKERVQEHVTGLRNDRRWEFNKLKELEKKREIEEKRSGNAMTLTEADSKYRIEKMVADGLIEIKKGESDNDSDSCDLCMDEVIEDAEDTEDAAKSVSEVSIPVQASASNQKDVKEALIENEKRLSFSERIKLRINTR